MFQLLDPEVWNVIFAIAGGLLGWWLRHQGGAAKPAPPTDLSERLRQLLEELLEAMKQQKEQKNG